MKRILVRSRVGLRRYPWWENFIHYIIENVEDHDRRAAERDRLLAEHNAKLIAVDEGSGKSSYLEFEHEEDSVIFILRWS